MQIQSACVLTKHLSRLNAASQPLLWLEVLSLLLRMANLGCIVALVANRSKLAAWRQGYDHLRCLSIKLQGHFFLPCPCLHLPFAKIDGSKPQHSQCYHDG